MLETKPEGCSGVKIPEGTVLAKETGDYWEVLNGPDKGKLEPMTEDEKALRLAWKQ